MIFLFEISILKSLNSQSFIHLISCFSNAFTLPIQLFVEKKFRGSGAGRALIEAVWEHCKTVGVDRLYWKTKEDNYVARILYDRVANCSGFVEYEKE